jgi:hypothetical protein
MSESSTITYGAGPSFPPSSPRPPHRHQAPGASYTYRKPPYEQTLHGSDPLSASPYTRRPPEPKSSPDGAYPPQTSSNVFRFSGIEETIMNSSVTDQWGRLVLVLSSTKYETNIVNGENRIVAILDWTHPHSLIEFRGRKMKIKEWLSYAEGKTYELKF